MDIRNEIIEKTDIVDLISEYVELRRRGSNYVGLCPFHNEKTPSFTVSPDKKIFKCFGCGKSGNVITFMMEYMDLSYSEAFKELAKRAGIKLERFDAKKDKTELTRKEHILNALEQANRFFQIILNTQSGSIARTYLANRGYLPHTIQEFQIGYAPAGWDSLFVELSNKGIHPDILLDAGLIKKKEGTTDQYFDIFRDRITFPIRNTTGKVVGFGARVLRENENIPKYINSPQTIVFDKSRLLFGLFEGRNEIRHQKSAILVEGYADVITLHQAGFRNSVASCGTSLTTEQLDLLSRYCNTIYLAYDSDEAGQNATVRTIQMALPLGFEVLIVMLPEGEDPDSVIKKYGVASVKSLLERAVSFVEFLVREAERKEILDRPAQKSQVIRTILNLINQIPDTIQHNDFLIELANLMKIPHNQINLLYQEKAKIPHPNALNFLTVRETNSQPLMPGPKNAESKLFPEEKSLIYFCLAENRNLDFVKTALKFGSNEMISSEGQMLFKIMEEHHKDDILHNILLDENIEQDIKAKLVDILFSQEEASQNWRKFGYDPNSFDVDKVLNDIVTKIKIRHIDEDINTIKGNLPFAGETKEELLMKYQQLVQRKQKLLKSLR